MRQRSRQLGEEQDDSEINAVPASLSPTRKREALPADDSGQNMKRHGTDFKEQKTLASLISDNKWKVSLRRVIALESTQGADRDQANLYALLFLGDLI